jgi:UDP-2,4-diacetamido-2,4,6-trideoxy-beta-L-altropyranose hydrolase
MQIFRVDYSSEIGFGHLKRSLVYAKNFKDVVYISKADKNLTPYKFYHINNEKEFFELVKKLTPKEVIVDNYNFTFNYQKEFKRLFPNIKLTIFDDTYGDYFCDEIINHNLGVNKFKYKTPEKVKIIPPLIDEKFIKLKNRKFKKDGIFVSFGATDSAGIGLKVLKLLKNKKINFYTTSANKNIKKLKRFAKLNKNIKLHINEDVALGMAKSKFAIITPSVISYEARFLKLPFFAIQIADNQKEIAKYFKKKRIRVIKISEIRKLKRFVL